MYKKLLCAALLAAGTVAAQAAETTWNFAYTGFVNAETGAPLNYQLTGSFRGEDANADGILLADELTYLQVQTYVLLEPFPENPDAVMNPGGCARTWAPYLKCQIDSFSYKTTGQLEFSIHHFGNDEASSSWSGSIVSGSHFGSEGGNWDTGSSWAYWYNWTDQTTFTISPPPVPEPSTVLLLPAGLAVLAAARRRQKKVAK